MKHIKRMTSKITCFLLALFLATGTFQISGASNPEQNPNITIDGNSVEFQLSSENGDLYTPAEEIYTALGADYFWDPLNSRAIIRYGTKSFTICEQDEEININGKMVRLTGKPYLKNDALMIPLVSVIESVGGGLWNASDSNYISGNHIIDCSGYIGRH